ncbi:MAG: site-specific integrase [Defluviitaleaceae bacterium]|nr:site-specific integrase [Defluviitaleaceae bacterium]
MTGILQAKKGRPNYFIVLDYIDEMTRQRKRKWISTDIPIKGNNKRLATAKLQEVLEEYRSLKVDLCNDVFFIDFMHQWLETLSRTMSIARSTYDTYSMVFNVHIRPYFQGLNLRLKELTPTHIQKYVNFKLASLSPNSVIKHMANITTCLNSAVRQNLIAFNPASRIEPLRKIVYKGAQFFNERQIEHLLIYSKGDPLELVVLLTVFYGLRRSEVLGLRWDAIDFENNTVAIRHTVVQVAKETHRQDSTKNESSNSVLPLPNMIKHELLKWREQQNYYKSLQPRDYIDEGYVCTYANGDLIKPNYVSQHFQLLLKRCGLPSIRFHDLRHSSASYLKYLGFDIKDIQTWLRHSDIQTTMNLYTHLDMDAKRGIADNLDQRFQQFNPKNLW